MQNHRLRILSHATKKSMGLDRTVTLASIFLQPLPTRCWASYKSFVSPGSDALSYFNLLPIDFWQSYSFYSTETRTKLKSTTQYCQQLDY